jgi:proteasome lid subunit RPN8/RPN11
VENNSVAITSRVKKEIEDHAVGARPNECCGLLSGDGRLIIEAHPLKNDSSRPQTSYFAAPEDLFSAMRAIRESRQVLMGVYHSHPRSLPYPSASDVEMAFYPDAFYFIISLEPCTDIKAFRIDDARIEPVAVDILDADR